MLFTLILLFATGLVAGVLAGLLGIGGGLVIVPALTWILLAQGASGEVAVPMAVATSLGTMLLTSASAIWFHDRRGGVDWACVGRLAPAVGLGALLGAWMAVLLPGPWLARVFALIAGLIGLRMLLARGTRVLDRPPWPRGWFLFGPLIGAVSAMIGIGGGSFNVPYLARNGYPMVRAVAIASTCGWPIALGGVIGFLVLGSAEVQHPQSFGYLYVPGLVMIGLAGTLGAPAGVALAHRLPQGRLKQLFGLILILVAIRMAW
ncbi:MAG: sulfite exporter TauE/SafE family protein [Wenzhouxiangella sp.]|nr:sulfite exporter TauE/SafE family protein [Wenzhouxiangella sp.]